MVSLERAKTPQDMEEGKKHLLSLLGREFKTYRMYWDNLVVSYNNGQESLYRKRQIQKPKKIDPEAALGIVFSPRHRIENALEELSQQLKALGQSDALDLDRLKNLIAQAHSLVFGHGDFRPFF